MCECESISASPVDTLWPYIHTHIYIYVYYVTQGVIWNINPSYEYIFFYFWIRVCLQNGRGWMDFSECLCWTWHKDQSATLLHAWLDFLTFLKQGMAKVCALWVIHVVRGFIIEMNAVAMDTWWGHVGHFHKFQQTNIVVQSANTQDNSRRYEYLRRPYKWNLTFTWNYLQTRFSQHLNENKILDTRKLLKRVTDKWQLLHWESTNTLK